jgi:hypothetical protein
MDNKPMRLRIYFQCSLAPWYGIPACPQYNPLHINVADWRAASINQTQRASKHFQFVCWKHITRAEKTQLRLTVYKKNMEMV